MLSAAPAPFVRVAAPWPLLLKRRIIEKGGTMNGPGEGTYWDGFNESDGVIYNKGTVTNTYVPLKRQAGVVVGATDDSLAGGAG